MDLETSAEHVRVLGGDLAHPSPLIELRAPVSGAIVEQNVAGFEGIKSLDNTPNLFTIADLTEVWVVCDVFENDLGKVALGDVAEIRLNAFPDRAFHGRVADISRVLDPNTRSAKVRIVLANAHGALRPGMFATATFRSRKLGNVLLVPTHRRHALAGQGLGVPQGWSDPFSPPGSSRRRRDRGRVAGVRGRSRARG